MSDTMNTDEVVGWAQAVLTALNVGDVKSGSPLHLKLREVMIAHRDAVNALWRPIDNAPKLMHDGIWRAMPSSFEIKPSHWMPLPTYVGPEGVE